MKILKELMLVHSVSGREQAVSEKIEEMIAPYVDEVRRDAMGNLICYKKGTCKNPKKLMLAGHMDEIGFLVTGIDEKGYIHVSSIGGIHYVSAAFSNVVFENGLKGVLVPEADFGNNFSESRFVIDIGATDKKETEKRVKVGDFASTVSHLEHLSGSFYSGRPFDDRIGCAIMVRAAQTLKDCKNDTWFVFTTQEEVGMRGAKPAAWAVDPEYALAVDVTCPDDQPGALHEATTKIGGGAAIKIMDHSVLCHRDVVAKLWQLAAEQKIPAQDDLLKVGGTDAGVIHVSRGGVRTGGVSIPCRYTHSQTELIDLADLEACVKLVQAFCESEFE